MTLPPAQLIKLPVLASFDSQESPSFCPQSAESPTATPAERLADDLLLYLLERIRTASQDTSLCQAFPSFSAPL